MNKVAMKLAVSTVALSTALGCSPAGTSYRPEVFSAKAPKEQQAAKYVQHAHAALGRGALDSALILIEQAVELSPRDAGYRLLLADLYLKKGRLNAAETTFGDVIALDPSNVRAGLSLALTQIALGKNSEAVAQLDHLAGAADASDLGLAYALAGQPQRAIQMLEPLARYPGANGRIRQNLALSYALAGDWERARATAAQDVSPDELAARMEQWAAFTQPTASYSQVASLLGITPVMDSGQPTHLALAPTAPASAAYAETSPTAVPEVQVETVAVDEAAVPAAEPAPAVETVTALGPIEVSPARAATETEQLAFADAAASLVEPKLEITPIASAPIKPFPLPESEAADEPFDPGRFVVQIGAFKTPEQVEKAWAMALNRYDFRSAEPFSTTVTIPGKGKFHRLSVAGFSSQAVATQMCREIRSKKGVCFVRAVAGDTRTQWASRYSRKG